MIIPTFNNATTVIDILSRIHTLGFSLIIVNDGCTDNTAALLQQWTREVDDPSGVVVCHHEKNRGKAEALRTGFKEASARGYSHAVTIDTDAQHDPEDIAKLVDVARNHVDALVLGSRSEQIDGYPAKSMVGRRLSNFSTRLACGLIISDSVCGLRVYPLSLVEAVDCRAQRFGFESEIIVRTGWAKCPVHQVEITSRYLPPDQRVSHYRPWRDTARCFWLYFKLVAMALLSVSRIKRLNSHSASSQGNLSRWRRLLSWLSPKALLVELRRGSIGRLSVAVGVSLGALIANLPIYPFQTVVSLFVAKRLHLHPLSVVGGSSLSTPPIGPILIVAALAVGHLLLYGSMPKIEELGRLSFVELFGVMLLEWTVGGLVVGLGCMVVVFCSTWGLLRLVLGPVVDTMAIAETE